MVLPAKHFRSLHLSLLYPASMFNKLTALAEFLRRYETGATERQCHWRFCGLQIPTHCSKNSKKVRNETPAGRQV